MKETKFIGYSIKRRNYFQQKSRCEPTEIIEFINNKTNETNVERDNKINKDESISLLKKTKNSRQPVQ